MRGSVVISFALLMAARCAPAQDVVSAASGVVQYFEGAVVLDGKLIEHKAAVFPSLKNGSIIRTEKGRAELLLTPGVYLRVDENSSLRMASNSLADTRLELLDGTAILDNLNANSSDATVLIFRGSEVRFPKPGVYRVDYDLGELQVYSGEAEVAHHGVSSAVDPSHLYYFALELTTSKFGDGAMDEFYDWARNRSDIIADQNQRASAEQADAEDPDPTGGLGIFGVPPLYSSPGYATPAPLLGSSIYGSGIDPYYLYPPTPYSGFGFFPSILVLAPYRHRPGGSKWPVSAGFRPPPAINGWPKPIPGITHFPGTAQHYPIGIYRPTSTPLSRPGVTAVPRMPSMYAAPHAAVPHVTAVGHR